jgi:hypothetical protein
MKLILFACAEGMALDARSNRISLFNLIESLASPVFPVAMSQVTIIAWFEKEAGDAEDVDLQTKWTIGNSLIGQMPLFLRFQGATRSRAISEVSGVVLPAPGSLAIGLHLPNGTEIGRWTMEVKAIPQQSLHPPAVQAGAATSS